jgi:hypothetical protein
MELAVEEELPVNLASTAAKVCSGFSFLRFKLPI